MSWKETLDTSIALSLVRYCYKWYGDIEQRLNYVYRHSQTAKRLNIFWEKIKVYFRYSFLARLTQIKQISSAVLDNSRTVQYLTNLYKRYNDKIANLLKASFTFNLARDAKNELYFMPVRIISIIVITAIVANLLLSLVLHKPIILWGWLWRGLFLFVAVSGLFSTVAWPAVERSSIFLWLVKHKTLS